MDVANSSDRDSLQSAGQESSVDHVEQWPQKFQPQCRQSRPELAAVFAVIPNTSTRNTTSHRDFPDIRRTDAALEAVAPLACPILS